MSIDAKNFYRTLSSLWKTLPDPQDAAARAAHSFLEALAGQGDYSDLPEPFRSGVEALYREFDSTPDSRKKAFSELEKLLSSENAASEEVQAKAVWKAFYPEALHLDEDPVKQIELLRDLRRVSIVEPAKHPISNAAQQIVITSNVLLSPPTEEADAADTSETADIIRGASGVNEEQQEYWYDHPIPIGTPVENDEVVYGLKGLAKALAFEKNRGVVGKQDRMQVFLSVSVTHTGLHEWAKPWLKARLAEIDRQNFDSLDVYAFSEKDTETMVDLLLPWMSTRDSGDLKAVFGVDGEYGRHYSFLKALPALWSVLGDTNIKATFKIDLDQVFPQEELVAETGKSAFELLTTPLWGAKAKDPQGRNLDLGMIAGALVNERDIAKGLFTPDIPWPEELPSGEELLFYKQRSMAVSTRAEMMTRYGSKAAMDGMTAAIQRSHVTGGTNGIRMDALRRHRPFTPGFIGRAEDQAYLLSVLAGKGDQPVLRYIHASGLIMRHDKAAFAAAAINRGKAGAFTGDLVRLFVFSAYAKCLPGGHNSVKAITDPFTGCFITPIPATTALLRLALHLLSSGSPESREDLLKLAAQRLTAWVQRSAEKSADLAMEWQKEFCAWNTFYDIIDRLEDGLRNGNELARETAGQFCSIVESCKITV